MDLTPSSEARRRGRRRARSFTAGVAGLGLVGALTVTGIAGATSATTAAGTGAGTAAGTTTTGSTTGSTSGSGTDSVSSSSDAPAATSGGS